MNLWLSTASKERADHYKFDGFWLFTVQNAMIINVYEIYRNLGNIKGKS